MGNAWLATDATLGELTLGVLGGGQLGKMLALAGGAWHLNIDIMDPSASCPAASHATNLVQGDFTHGPDVTAFGRTKDVVTIEIENVNVDALDELERQGVTVRPQPSVIRTIQDKSLQKQFFKAKSLPSSPFTVYAGRAALLSANLVLPCVQKACRDGYDGKGVRVLRTPEDVANSLDSRCIIEPLVDIDKELSVIVARSPSGDMRSFPPVEMVFDERANLVDRLICPARLGLREARMATEIAEAAAVAFAIEGLLAVELFLTRDGDILINEVAPRPHNSGHHTIESCLTSQYEQHLRAVLDLPLGSTELKVPAVLVNLLGEPDRVGPVRYEGLRECMAKPGVKVHLYGKKETRPFRKMGHVTILDPERERALETADYVRQTLKVTT